MDSDVDSDFYGDEDHASQLQERVDSFDVENYCQARASHPGRPLRRATLAKDVTQLHNPYANIEYAWQLTETVESFLQRLPPETTPQNHKTPWIFICNPFIPRAAKVDSSTTRREDDAEAPEEDGSNVQMLVTGAEERLDLLRSFIEKTEETKKTKAAKEKAIAKERSGATSDILNLAAMQKVRAGKWMLFCSPREVNEVWAIVAKSTADNELGIAAKVAPRSETEDPRKDRLVCVYTADFSNKADVGRVLQKLRELKLVEVRVRPIYYKPDAYTYIGISSGNPWGIRASIYSSLDSFS